MEKFFKVKVNGTEYDVAVREVKGVSGEVAPVAAPVAEPVVKQEVVAQPTPPKQEEKAPVAAPAPSAGAIKVTAPMPGNIWKLKTKVGDSVNKHDVLLILEAMKMENEIVAPEAGTVTNILVKEGDSVNPGQVMVELG